MRDPLTRGEGRFPHPHGKNGRSDSGEIKGGRESESEVGGEKIAAVLGRGGVKG